MDKNGQTPSSGQTVGVDDMSWLDGGDDANLSKDELLALRINLTYLSMDAHSARANGLISEEERHFLVKAVGRIKCLIDTLAYSTVARHDPR